MVIMGVQASRKKECINFRISILEHHNQPIELWSEKVIKQKIDYIHNNPVETGFVTDPIDWKYSSARNYQEDNTILEIDSVGFLG
jgi:hypothetical protein